MLSARQASTKSVITNQLRLDQLGQEKERVKMQVLGCSKDVQDSSGLYNDIFSFNTQVGKGFLLCLQNQMNLAQIFMELVQTFESDKIWEYFSTKSFLQTEDKMPKAGDVPSQDFFSVHNQTNKERSLSFISSKIEKMIGDLSTLLGPLQSTKSDVSTDTYKYYTSTSPLTSSRTWTQDIKRSSVPVVVNKSKDFNTIIPPKNQPEYSINDRRSSTDNSQLSNKLKATQTTVIDAAADPNNVKKFLKSKTVSLNKNKSSLAGMKTSPRNFEDIKDKSKFTTYAQENSKFSNSGQANREYIPNRDLSRKFEKERSVSDKFILKPTMGHIPRKDLIEESLNVEDKTFNSSNSSHQVTQNNETAQMFRMPDMEENSLIMSVVNNTKDTPLSEKKIIKDLLKEERDGKALTNQKGNEKRNLIDAKWWRAWKEYVNFDCDGDFKNIIIGIYPRPGRIVNRGLLKYEIIQDFGQMSGDLELRENLLEHHDYEIVNKKVFDLLSKWYGCDFELVRALKVDPFRKNKLYLDLYPEKGFNDAKHKIARVKSASPKGEIGNGNVISNIVQSNLQNFSSKSRHENKNPY